MSLEVSLSLPCLPLLTILLPITLRMMRLLLLLPQLPPPLLPPPLLLLLLLLPRDFQDVLVGCCAVMLIL